VGGDTLPNGMSDEVVHGWSPDLALQPEALIKLLVNVFLCTNHQTRFYHDPGSTCQAISAPVSCGTLGAFQRLINGVTQRLHTCFKLVVTIHPLDFWFSSPSLSNVWLNQGPFGQTSIRRLLGVFSHHHGITDQNMTIRSKA
jgi:hypothetical protein